MIPADLVSPLENRVAALDAAIARGLAEADAGQTKPAEAMFAPLQRKYQAISAAHLVP